jgi:hypothetical protein
MFIIPPASQVTWTGANSWDSVYSTANVNSYVSTTTVRLMGCSLLTSAFIADSCMGIWLAAI